MGSNPDNILFDCFSLKFFKFNFHCSGSKFNLLPVLFNNPSGTGCRLFRHFFPEPAAGSLATSFLVLFLFWRDFALIIIRLVFRLRTSTQLGNLYSSYNYLFGVVHSS